MGAVTFGVAAVVFGGGVFMDFINLLLVKCFGISLCHGEEGFVVVVRHREDDVWY